MNWKKLLVGGGLAAAAPFVGGATLPWLPAALGTAGVGTALGGAFESGKPKADKGTTVGGGSDEATQALIKNAGTQRGNAADLKSQGQDALSPVLDYFKKLMGNDPQAVLEATKPERGRVMDQYDTARNAIANFAPRGGGSNAAAANSYVQEAQQIGDITSTAKREATGQMAQIGTALEGLGLSADQLASADLNTVINAALQKQYLDVQKHGQNMQAVSGLGEGLGELLALYLTRSGGKWERGGAPKPAVAG